MRAACLGVMLLCSYSFLFGRAVTGILVGTVTDPTDAVVPNASVVWCKKSTSQPLTITPSLAAPVERF